MAISNFNRAVAVVASLLLLVLTSQPTSGRRLNPVILVPGDGGSQIEAKLNITDYDRGIFGCAKVSDWFTLWLSLGELWDEKCLVKFMKLNYDRQTHRTHNHPGVDIRVPGFGNTSTVEWLTTFHLYKTRFSYYYEIVEHLVTKLNYTRNVSVRGAPYDFRKSPMLMELNDNERTPTKYVPAEVHAHWKPKSKVPIKDDDLPDLRPRLIDVIRYTSIEDEMSELMDRLVDLVEETYRMNNNTRVVFLAHSMGNNVILYFLNHRPAEWKDRYIAAFITMAAPWAGLVKPMRLMASGDSLDQPHLVINPLTARPLEQSMTSSAWLMPSDLYWPIDEVLIYTHHANYTVDNFREFFDAVEFPDGYLMRKDTEHLIKKLEAPGVEVHCLYGSGIDTPAAFSYDSTSPRWFDTQPTVMKGDGDGTVNLRSLQACDKWRNEQNALVHLQEFPGAQHLEILQNKDIRYYIARILQTLK